MEGWILSGYYLKFLNTSSDLGWAVPGCQCRCCCARLQRSRALFLLLGSRWICPSQQKSLIAVLVSQFQLSGSKAVSSFPWHCLRGREPFWWIGDSRTPSSRFVFVFLQNHTGRFFSKCIFDKPFSPVPSLCFPLFSPSRTDDRRIWVFEEWDSSVIQILFAPQTRTGVKKGVSG